jgi:hypothetical protein
MSHFLSRFGFVLFAMLIGSFGLAVAYHRSRKHVSTHGKDRSWLDYVLLWPLLFENSSTVDRSRRLLTNRELIGWLIVATLIVVGIVFF